MDMNLYALERQAQAKIEEARHAAARGALLGSLRAARSPRVIAGVLLIRIGRWLGGRATRRQDVPLERARIVCAPGRAR